ncbi:hypothetical protein EW146_g8611 [Bondarzewia mesenterica]|uniref:Nitrate reductase [NADPH] n=1 Tax=Bondarzewia mesenterica TaxID=1095465 RepID=A0A4S4LDH5_9AGAM|nr:hypothetical protein EW146_g8611 [Bondarzewia mesenterica]
MSQTCSISICSSHQLSCSCSPAAPVSKHRRGCLEISVEGITIVRETESLSPVHGRGKTRIMTSRGGSESLKEAENDVEESDMAESVGAAMDVGSYGTTSITSTMADSDSEDKLLVDAHPSPLVRPSLLATLDLEIKAPPVLPANYPKMPEEHLKVPPVVDKQDEGTPDGWLKRDERLIRLTGKHPFNCEAPLKMLFDAGFLTPTSLFYVRNHGAVPRASPDEVQSWTIEISGYDFHFFLHCLSPRANSPLLVGSNSLVKRPMTLTLAELQSGMGGRLPTVTLPVTLVCAGNRRREQNVVRKSLGFNWGAAGLSTALFTGVYLADLLDYVGVAKGRRGGDGEACCVRGRRRIAEWTVWDEPELGAGEGKVERDDDCLENERATTRVRPSLVPKSGKAYIGGRSVKWLKRIEVSEKESQHHLHFWDNKVLPTQVMPEEARKERHWWYDPKYIINDLNVNSAIAHPTHDEILDVTPPSPTTDPEGSFSLPVYTLRGYAYAGGGRRVCRVEVSLDEGYTWKLAEIMYPEDLYRAVVVEDDPIWGTLDLSERETCFCWCFWKFEVEIEALAADGVGAVMVRAMDESLALQPRDMYWNPTGMMNNWWFRIAIHKSQAGDGKTTLRFEHPTLAGVKEGGWMQRIKDEDGLEAVLTPTFGIKDAAELAEAAKKNHKKKCDEVVMTKEGVHRVIKLKELKAHSVESEPWFVVNGEVYNGTAFLDKHPGGPDSIALFAGDDASEDFIAIHSAVAKGQLAEFHIGTLEGGTGAKSGETVVVEPTFLCKTKWKPAKLVTISHISHDTRIFRFALQSPEQDLDLPTGQHVFARMRRKGNHPEADTESGFVQRAYTPVSNRTAKGFIELLVKIYSPTPEFPLGGKMTGGFAELEIGDSVEFKGPIGSFVWKGDGRLSWRGQERKCRTFALICGGSGITPIIQVIRSVLEDETDTETKLWLIDANRTRHRSTEKDILLYDELQNWVRAKSERFKVHHVLSKASPGFDGSSGYIDEQHIREHLPPPSDGAMVLICGPPGLVDTAKPNLKSCGWNVEESLVIF